MKNEGIYKGLVEQVDKIANHNNQGSYKTRQRYHEANKRFCGFLADEYRVQKLANISGKHLVAYVEHMQERGLSASTIKTDLAAIRFFHDKMDNAKYRLPDNNELGADLERRRFGGVDRAWTTAEFHRALIIAAAADHEDYVLAFYLARLCGLRIHECFRIDTAIAEQGLRENAITVKGKGGKIRTVPIEDERVPMMLKKLLAVTQRGHKLLVPDDKKTDIAMRELQNFIYVHRHEIQDPGDSRPLTFHGLRHSYSAGKYKQFLDSGKSPLDAHFAVSRLLGHERPDVTNVYLASLKEEERYDQ